MAYKFAPPTPEDVNARILIEIKVEKKPAIAAVDTGAPYLILSPMLAEHLAFDPLSALDQISINIRGWKIKGKLHRVYLDLPAAEGEGHRFEATAFFPDPEEADHYGDLPSFLGMQDCLDRVRFAIDPYEEKFYFGPRP